MSRREFEIWQTRASLIPFGWIAKEREIARLEGASGNINPSDCFNNYLDSEAYDEDNYEFAQDYINNTKG